MICTLPSVSPRIRVILVSTSSLLLLHFASVTPVFFLSFVSDGGFMILLSVTS
jgi:hypothetical protein